MKFTVFSAFQERVAKERPAGPYLLVSKEPFERDRALNWLRGQLLQAERQPELCSKTFDGETLAIQELLEELQTPPFLTKYKLLIVHSVEKLAKADLKRLEEQLGSMPRSVGLVMTADLPATSTFYKKAEAAGLLLDVATKKGAAKEGDLAAWVERVCQELGKKIDGRTALLLVRQVGDSTLLPQEIEKLCCYLGDRMQITPQDLSSICCGTFSETVWQLGDALLRSDTALALRVGRGLLDSGTALLALLGQLRYQLQTGLQISSLLAGGADLREVTKQFPYLVGSLLEKQCRVASEYGVARFIRGLIALTEAEGRAKDGAADASLLLERLLFTLTVRT